MAHKAKGSSSSSAIVAQVVAFIGLILAAYFLVGFARVTLASYRARALKAKLEAEVTALEGDITKLQKKLEYVQTDEYVEEAARTEFRMVRPGDRPVVPLFRGKAVGPAITGVPAAQPAPKIPPWRAWWLVFFDQ